LKFSESGAAAHLSSAAANIKFRCRMPIVPSGSWSATNRSKKKAAR